MSENASSNRQAQFGMLQHWMGKGLSVRAATVIAAADCQSLDDIRRLGWWYFQGQRNCGLVTLMELSELVGGWPDMPARRHNSARRLSDKLLVEELHRRGVIVASGKAP